MIKKQKNKFGSALKKLRSANGISIKQLSSKVDVNYSYISKLENNRSNPSEEFISKIALLFECDKEELMLKAGKIPPDLLEILVNNPKKAATFLRKQFTENGH